MSPATTGGSGELFSRCAVVPNGFIRTVGLLEKTRQFEPNRVLIGQREGGLKIVLGLSP